MTTCDPGYVFKFTKIFTVAPHSTDSGHGLAHFLPEHLIHKQDRQGVFPISEFQKYFSVLFKIL